MPRTVSLLQGVSCCYHLGEGDLKLGMKEGAGTRCRISAHSCNLLPPVRRGHPHPAVIPGPVLISSSVLFSLLSLGLPGQQQHPQVISCCLCLLALPSALSVPLCAHSTGATPSGNIPLMCPLSFLLSQRPRLFPNRGQAGAASAASIHS